jgi:hypothetical protein
MESAKKKSQKNGCPGSVQVLLENSRVRSGKPNPAARTEYQIAPDCRQGSIKQKDIRYGKNIRHYGCPCHVAEPADRVVPIHVERDGAILEAAE